MSNLILRFDNEIPFSDYVNVNAGEGTELIRDPGVPFKGRGNKCKAKNDTCNGPRMKGEDFCYGHMRSVLKGRSE